jgi:hypothetical protein
VIDPSLRIPIRVVRNQNNPRKHTPTPGPRPKKNKEIERFSQLFLKITQVVKKQEIDTAQEPKKREASTQQKRESDNGTRSRAGKKRWCEKSMRAAGSFCASQSDSARCTYSAAELAAGLCAMYAFQRRTCYTSVRDIPIPRHNLLPECA